LSKAVGEPLFDALVTGAGGFIGRHLVQFLSSMGLSVIVVARAWPDGDSLLKLAGVQKAEWDIGMAAPALPPCRWWFHLAAVTDIAFCNQNPERAKQINAYALDRLLNVAGETCQAFILVSTLGVYGDPQYVPTDEAHPRQPIEMYAQSKSLAEERLFAIEGFSGRRIVARLFNTYGPGQQMRMLIPSLVKQACQLDQLTLRNLDHTRDFIFCSDVARGLYLCAKKAINGDVINFGTGVESSAADLISVLEELLDKELKVDVEAGPSNFAVVRRSCANIDFAWERLAWNPQVSIREGLLKVISAEHTGQRA